MARRRTYTRPCARTGCPERSFVEYTARRDLEGVSPTWLCPRHAKPNEQMSPTNTDITTVLELHPKYRTKQRYDHAAGRYMNDTTLLGYFWGPEGDPEHAYRGIESGPGFRATAEDFPPGTRLVVTARIVLPQDTQADQPNEPCPTCGSPTDDPDLDRILDDRLADATNTQSPVEETP